MARTTTKQADLEDMLLRKLSELYDVEQRIVKALPKMAKHATNEELKEGFEAHTEETKKQAEKLEDVFAKLEIKPKAESSEAIRGLTADAERMMSECPKGEALDAGLAAAARSVEHFEIASYGSAVDWARELGKDEVADALEEILKEEEQTDEKLHKMGERTLYAAARVAGEQE